MSTKEAPLSHKLREKAVEINKLLEEYETLRYGDEIWRFGDEQYRKSKGKQGTPPHQEGQAPRIFVVSSPQNIFAVEENSENNRENPNRHSNEAKRAVNPVLQALKDLGDIDYEIVERFQLENRYSILLGLGIRERYNAAALIKWVRELASEITYILETREIYSAEIKAIYPELLNDLEVARSTCDQLANNLANQKGIVTSDQYTKIMVTLLHYAKIAQQAALQLADHHEEFVTAEISPLESGPEIEWVFKEEAKPLTLKEEEKPKEKE